MVYRILGLNLTGYWEHLITYNNTKCLTIVKYLHWKVKLPPDVNH